MARALALALALVGVVACDGDHDSNDAAGGSSASSTASSSRAATSVASSSSDASSTSTGSGTTGFGLNDVSILVPLPLGAEPVLFAASDATSEPTAILPREIHDLALAIPGRPGELGEFYDSLELVAIRFDLCDRVAPVPCPADADGSLRLVFQPIMGATGVDLGFHAFFTIPNAELPTVVTRLRDLAALRGAAPSSLSPATALSDPGPYRDGVRALVSDLARGTRLVRVTTMGQVLIAAAFRWVFHGVELKDGAFVEMDIPDVSSTVEDVLLLADASYGFAPSVDVPTGLGLVLRHDDFLAATPDEQAAALRVLVDVDNPDVHTASTVQCPACHVSTVVLAKRADALGLDPATLPGSFTSPLDLSIAAGGSADDDTILHGFGWVSGTAAISQRVVNESAKVVSEIEARYPSP